jgi:hypothetical protein
VRKGGERQTEIGSVRLTLVRGITTTTVIGSGSNKERSGDTKGRQRVSTATSSILSAAITIVTQTTRMTRVHDLQSGGSCPKFLL